MSAHDQLKASGIAVRVIDLYSISPIDRATLLDSARATQGRQQGRRHQDGGQHVGVQVGTPTLGDLVGLDAADITAQPWPAV